MASLKEKLQQSFIEDNPAMGVLRGIKSAFAGADEVESTNLRGLSSEERIAKLRGSIDQNLPTSGSLFGEEIGGVIADLPQGTARAATFVGEKVMGSMGLDTGNLGSDQSSQFLLGSTGDRAESLPELGEQEFGIDAQAKPILAGLAGTVAVGLETPFGKPFKSGTKAVSDLVKDMEFESVSKKLRDMFKSLDDSELDELSQTISQSNNSGVVSRALTNANFNNVVKSSGNAAIRRGADADLVQGNVANVVLKGGDVDANGYVDVYISGTPDQIKQLRASGDPTGLLASIKKSKKVSDDVVFTKVKVPGEDISFKLGNKVALSEGAISRSLGVTDSKIAKSASNITDDAARLEIEDAQDVIRSLSTVGSKASENKLATVNKVRNSLDEIARKYAGNYQSIEPAIQAATTPRQFKSILQDIAQGVESGTITPSSKVRSIMTKANRAQTGNVKTTIRKETGQIKDHELSLLNEQVQNKANKALAEKSAKDLVVAKEVFDSVNSNVVKDVRGAKVNVTDKAASKSMVDIIDREVVGEYAIGKSAKALRTIQKPSEDAVDNMAKLRLDDTKREAVFNYRESKDESFLSGFSKDDVKAIKDVDDKITETTNIIGDYLVDLNLLDEKGAADTYMQTFLRNTDGSVASDARVSELRMDMGDNFTELMSSFSQTLNKTKLKKNRKYDTAIERDQVLEKYGLTTDKDIERVFSNYVANTSKLIEKEVISSSIRDVAKSGARDDLIEVFDPKLLKQQRDALTNSVKGLREELLADLSSFKEVTKGKASELRASKKDFDISVRGLGDDVDVLDLQGIDAQQVDTMFDDIIEAFADTPSKVRKAIDYKVNVARTNAKKELRGIYGDISKRYGEASDSGLKWVAGNSAPSLRGVMGNQRDTKLVDEIFRFRDADTISGNIDQISQTLKLATATGDLFSIPRAYWMAAQATNPIKAAQIWKKSLRANTVDEALINEFSEFGLVSRNTVGDADTLKRIQSDLERDLSGYDKFMKNLDDKTDVGVLTEAKDKVATGFRELEKWQFETFMTQAKAQTWEISYKQLMKKGVPEREAKVEAGRLVDKLSGVTDFNKLMARNPKMLSKDVQKSMRILLFAPNLLLTTIRTMGLYSTDLFAAGAKGMLARKAALQTVTMAMGTLQAMSYMINGRSTFENDDPNKVLAVQMPFKDEQGNDFYLNPIGWIARPFELANKPLKTISNKVGGLSRFGLNLYSGRPFENTAESRVGEAVSGVIPIPFTLQNIVQYGKAQFTDEPQYGVADNPMDQMMITALEFFGAEGVFTGGGSKTTSLAKMYQEVDKAIEENKDFDHMFSPEMLEAYLLSKDMPSKKDIYKARYDISGKTTDDSFLEKVKAMDSGARQDFIEGYAASTQAQIRRDLGNVGGDELDFNFSSDDLDFSGGDSEELDFGFDDTSDLTF